jgi:microcystin-dependent protein
LTAKTGSWAGLTVSAGNLDGTTYGQGTSFPSSWDVSRLFWRSDLKRLYYNKGTSGSPLWEGADVPVGTINMYAGAVADIPTGWLLCNGAAVSRTTYAQLFAVLDTEYGVGDGSGTFNVPNFVTSNKFPRAATNDAGRGTTGGASDVTLTGAESGAPAHSHSLSDPGHSHQLHGSPTNNSPGVSGISATPFSNKTSNGATNTVGATTGITISNSAAVNASSAHENKPPFIDVHFIIAV